MTSSRRELFNKEFGMFKNEHEEAMILYDRIQDEQKAIPRQVNGIKTEYEIAETNFFSCIRDIEPNEILMLSDLKKQYEDTRNLYDEERDEQKKVFGSKLVK